LLSEDRACSRDACRLWPLITSSEGLNSGSETSADRSRSSTASLPTQAEDADFKSLRLWPAGHSGRTAHQC